MVLRLHRPRRSLREHEAAFLQRPQRSSSSYRASLFAAVLVVPTLFLFTVTQLTLLSPLTPVSKELSATTTVHSHSLADFVRQPTSRENTPRKYAVVNFVDKKQTKSLWGIYSIHKQMQKFDMLPTIRHVVLVASDMHPRDIELIEEWVGSDNMKIVDETVIRNRVPKGVWSHVFSKLDFFNLTEFDKVIGLDNDIFICQNIQHWLTDYPTPAATQARGTIEWNSGAMVITPDTHLYNKLLEYIPKTRRFDSKVAGRDHDPNVDTWNSGQGQQGFLSSFLLSNVTNDTMFTMNYASSVLSSDLMEQKGNHYYWRYRRNVIETVHLTHKPWKKEAAPSKSEACEVYKDWLASVADAPKDRLVPLYNFLRKCNFVDEEVVGMELLTIRKSTVEDESVEEESADE